MAINPPSLQTNSWIPSPIGLNMLRTTMTDCWGYGDILFGEIGDINENHDNIYPLCLVVPPTSSMPSIYEGWEDYTYEVYFL